MKYWIFQNNQVLGPYEPDDMSKMSAFSPESLVCPEGRRGTSMGDWQRAGMVPDLSVALVRASSSTGGKTAVLSIAGLPPEPTLKDLAALGSLQEKVAMLEDVVLQLQEGLRAKDAELTAVHQELAGKSRESSELKDEASGLHKESEALKRQLAGLEERLASVRTLSETLDKAVEEEKRVEQDVEKQGRTLADLAAEVESLRKQMDERPAAPAPSFSAEPPVAAGPSPFAPPEPSPFAPPASVPPPLPLPSATPDAPAPVVDIDFPSVAPAPSLPPPPAETAAPLPSIDPMPLPMPGMAEPAPLPTPMPMPESSGLPSAAPVPVGFDPMSFGGEAGGALAPEAAPGIASLPADAGVDTGSAAAPPKSKKGILVVAGLLGAVALGGAAFMGGFIPGLKKPQAPPEVVEPAPLPPPEPVAPPPPDQRETAVALAKDWTLPDGKTLGMALEKLAPPSGNLSPWMAEVLLGGRVQVNYFARGAAPGSPTIAYEFEVDVDAKTLVGRNAAAKSVLTGKAAAPPEPPKAKPVKVKPKKAPVEEKPVDEASLDNLLDEPGAEVPSGSRPKPSAKPAAKKPVARDPGEDLLITEPGADLSEPDAEPSPEAPRKAAAGKRAAKAKGKAADDKPADEELLDDLLQE